MLSPHPGSLRNRTVLGVVPRWRWLFPSESWKPSRMGRPPLAVLCPWKDFPYIQPQPPQSQIIPIASLVFSALIKRSLGPSCLHLCRLSSSSPVLGVTAVRMPGLQGCLLHCYSAPEEKKHTRDREKNKQASKQKKQQIKHLYTQTLMSRR